MSTPTIWAEAKVIIVNKSASVATVTYTNWTASTSYSIPILAGTLLTTYNWWESQSGTHVAAPDNIFNLPIDDTNPLTKTLLKDFGYDIDRVSITLTPGTYTQ